MPEEAKRRLSPVAEGEFFITKEGEEIKSLEHLLETLNNTSEENFRHHVNEYKNDYRDWVKYSIKDEALALELSKTIDFEKTKEIVKKRIEELKKRVHMGELIKKINYFNMQNSKKKKSEVTDDDGSGTFDLGSDSKITNNLAEAKDENMALSADSGDTRQVYKEKSENKESSNSYAEHPLATEYSQKDDVVNSQEVSNEQMSLGSASTGSGSGSDFSSISGQVDEPNEDITGAGSEPSQAASVENGPVIYPSPLQNDSLNSASTDSGSGSDLSMVSGQADEPKEYISGAGSEPSQAASVENGPVIYPSPLQNDSLNSASTDSGSGSDLSMVSGQVDEPKDEDVPMPTGLPYGEVGKESSFTNTSMGSSVQENNSSMSGNLSSESGSLKGNSIASDGDSQGVGSTLEKESNNSAKDPSLQDSVINSNNTAESLTNKNTGSNSEHKDSPEPSAEGLATVSVKPSESSSFDDSSSGSGTKDNANFQSDESYEIGLPSGKVILSESTSPNDNSLDNQKVEQEHAGFTQVSAGQNESSSGPQYPLAFQDTQKKEQASPIETVPLKEKGGDVVSKVEGFFSKMKSKLFG